MSDRTKIEWSDATWNPVTGCTEVSPGCDHCYAKTFAERWRGTPGHYFEHGFDVQLRPDKLDQPLRWRKPRRIFVNSMSDLFHDQVPDGYIAQVWEVMAQCPQHTFQILTKRHARMRSWVTRWHDTSGDKDVQGSNGLPPMPRGPEAVREVYSSPRSRLFADMLDSMGTPPEGAAYPLYDWAEGPRWFSHVLPNVWLGVSAENQQWADIRIPALLDTPAAVRFVSAEPLLGRIELRQEWGHGPGIDWIIAGGESGRAARPTHPDWVRALRDQRHKVGAAFFFKQWGEWAPAPWHGPDGATHAFTGGLYQEKTGAWVENFMEIGHRPTSTERDLTTPPGAQGMRHIGKKHAGRELDGRTWDEYPQQVTA